MDSPRAPQPPIVPQQQPPDPRAAVPADGGLLDQPDIIELNWEMLAKSPITIGRGSDTDIRLDHKTVSRRHSELRRDPFGRWTVRDLGSRNGTSVNGVPVRERELLGGDEINIGQFTLRFPMMPQADQGQALKAALSVDDAGALEVITLQEQETLAPPHLLASHLGTLLDLGHQLLGEDDSAVRMRILCRLVTGTEFRATGAAFLRVTPQTAHAPSIVGAAELLPGRPWYISRTLISSVLRSKQPAMGTSANTPVSPAALEMSIEVHRDDRAIAAIACPLAELSPGTLDILYVCLPSTCGTAEWLALMALSARQFTQAESIWQARKQAQAHAVIEQELGRARSIQERLTPAPFDGDRLEVFVHMEPCRWVGGDYADIIPLPDGRVFIAVADVCGKGIQAALIASGLHTLVRTAVDIGLSLDRVMETANRHLCQYLPIGAFVTLSALEIDMTTGRMACANAGHPPAIVIQADGQVVTLPAGENFPLGVDPAAPICKPYNLAPGDTVALFTDGWTEARHPDGSLLGQNRFQDCLSTALKENHPHLHEVPKALIAKLGEMGVSNLEADDRAIVLAHYK